MQGITLCGREYSLRFSINSLCCLEEKMEKGLPTLLKTDLSSLRALLWCGLLEQEKHLTLEDTGRLLEAHLQSGGSLAQVSRAVAQALEGAGFFPQPGKEKEKEKALFVPAI